MRCPKCGFISFDGIEKCNKCGMSFQKMEELLGAFLVSKRDVNWFQDWNDVQSCQDSRFHTSMESTPVSEIDVSDLLPESQIESEEIVEIEEKELKRIAEDEEFQKALQELT